MKTQIEIEVQIEGTLIEAKYTPTRSNAYDYEPAQITNFKVTIFDIQTKKNIDITDALDQITFNQVVDEYMTYLESEHH